MTTTMAALSSASSPAKEHRTKTLSVYNADKKIPAGEKQKR